MKLNLEEAKSVVRRLNKAIAMMETQPELRNKVIAMSVENVREVEVAGFENWSKERQDAYMKRHPGSKRKSGGGATTPAKPAKPAKAEKPAKADRIKKVKKPSEEELRKERLLNSQTGKKKVKK